MELRQIKYFETICRLKSFTRAAEELHISQPALSITLRNLEEELGTRLLYRNNKQVELTTAGTVFLSECYSILNAEGQLLRSMEDYNNNQHATFHLGFPSTIGAWLWPIVMEEFPSHYPDITIIPHDMGTNEVLEALHAGALDLGYSILDFIEKTNITTAAIGYGEARLLLHSQHPLAACEKIPLNKLQGENIIMYRKGTTFTEQCFRNLLDMQRYSFPFYYVREQSTVFNIVCMNLGVSVILDDSIDLIRQNPNFCVRELETPIRFETGLLWSRERQLPKSARLFVDYMRQRPGVLRKDLI